MKHKIKGFIGDNQNTENIVGRKLSAVIGDFKPSSRVRTAKGLLCQDAVLAIAPQIREYHPTELGVADWHSDIIRLYTPAEVLFSPQLMNNIHDVADNHPANNQVTPDNWKRYVIGTVSNPRRVGDEFRGDLLIKDATAIDNIESKKKTELSIGYEFSAEFTAGVTESGEPYDAIITSMAGDHVALVKVGRGGKRVRIGDEDKQENKPVKVKIQLANGQVWEVEVDGNAEAFKQSFDADQLALKEAQEKLGAEVKIGEQSFKASDTVAIQAAFTALNTELASTKTEADELKKSAVKPEDIEKLAAERETTIAEAKNLKPDLEPSGKSVEQIISEAVGVHAEDPSVVAVLEGVAIGDAKPEKIQIAFKVLSAVKPQSNKINGKAGDSATAEALALLNNNKSSISASEMIAQQKAEAWKGVQK